MVIEKQYVQERGKTSFVRSNGFLFAEFCMGVGKTKLAIDILDMVKTEVPNRKMRALFICHTTNSRDKTIPDEFKLWHKEHYITNRELALVQYEALDKIYNYDFDVVIFDEVHLITERRYQFFKRNRCSRVLLLSGTRPDDPQKMAWIEELCHNNIIVYDLVQATKHGTVNDIKFKLVQIEMSEAENIEYARLHHKLLEAQRQIYSNDFMLRLAINARMWFIYKNKSKRQATMFLIDNLRKKGKRFIIFTPTKEQARELSPYTVFSGKDDVDLQRFIRQDINELASVKQMEAGQNFPNLHIAVAQQINSKKHNVQQMGGRLLRSDQTATFYIIVLKDTVDERWVTEATSTIPKEKVIRYDIARSHFENIPVRQ